jgi:glyoxylase-like metal-dependent hydrolase (beta-lactamase superfamily II)
MSTPPPSGEIARLSPRVRRLIAPNRGPFTFTGTCTYIVGEGRIAVIDPGPADESHIAALLAATQRETIEAILVTHTHRDHSPGARLLQARIHAPIIGCAPHVTIENAPSGRLDASHDLDHVPDEIMHDGALYSGDGFTLEAVTTPGHASNHLAFSLAQEDALFSGDHVMGWSTTIVAPPDGNMAAYMDSLEKLRARGETIFYPGHGTPVADPQRYMKHLVAHRKQRESAILQRIEAGDRHIAKIVAHIYEGLDAKLQGAAALSVLAHLEDLVTRGLVVSDVGAAMLEARFTLR